MSNKAVRNNKNCNVEGCNLNKSQKMILKELLKCKEGHRVQSLEKLTKIKGRTIYDNLKKLSNKGLVENVFPIWKLCMFQGNYENVANLIKDFGFQLHDLAFILRLIRKPEWWDKRENKIVCFDNYETSEVGWGNNPYTQLKNRDYVIQLFKNTIIVILRNKYFGNEPYDCFLQGVEDFLEVLNFIEQKFRFKFLIEGVPQVSIKSQHYVKINDVIAQKCKRVGKGFEIVINGKPRLWVDMSKPFGLEAGDKDDGYEDISRYEDNTKEIMLGAPKNSELSIKINQIADSQLNIQKIAENYATHINGHIGAIKSMDSTAIEIRDGVKELTSVIKILIEKNAN